MDKTRFLRFVEYIQNRGIFISALFTAFLVVTAFFPIPQIVLLELAYFYDPLTDITTLGLMPTYFIINAILSVGILLLFYFTNGTFWIVTCNSLALIFLYPTLIYAFHELSTPIRPLLSAAIVYGIGMIGVAIFKVGSITANPKS